MANHSLNEYREPIPLRRRSLPQPDTPGLSDARLLPDDDFRGSWLAVILAEGEKNRIAQTAAAGYLIRRQVAFERIPLPPLHR